MPRTSACKSLAPDSPCAQVAPRSALQHTTQPVSRWPNSAPQSTLLCMCAHLRVHCSCERTHAQCGRSCHFIIWWRWASGIVRSQIILRHCFFIKRAKQGPNVSPSATVALQLHRVDPQVPFFRSATFQVPSGRGFKCANGASAEHMAKVHDTRLLTGSLWRRVPRRRL